MRGTITVDSDADGNDDLLRWMRRWRDGQILCWFCLGLVRLRRSATVGYSSDGRQHTQYHHTQHQYQHNDADT